MSVNSVSASNGINPYLKNNQNKETDTNTAPVKSTELSGLNRDVVMLQVPAQNTETLGQKILKAGVSIGTTIGIIYLLNRSRGHEVVSTLGSNIKSKNIFESLDNAMKLEEMSLPKSLIETVQKVKQGILAPDIINNRGGRPIKSILLYGPPGTGKTTFAKAIAKMFPDSEFASIDVTSLTSKYVGESEKNFQNVINDICTQAEENPGKKIFVFIDEIDSVMMQDPDNKKYSNDLLNEFKRCFSERLAKHKNIITIGATNIDIASDEAMRGVKQLDKPMLDRFDQKILVDLPTSEQIIKTISSHYKGKPLVDGNLADAGSEKLRILSEFLADKKHKASFRTLDSIFTDAATSIEDNETKVGMQNIFNTIVAKRNEMNISSVELADLADKLGVKFDNDTLPQDILKAARKIGFM